MRLSGPSGELHTKDAAEECKRAEAPPTDLGSPLEAELASEVAGCTNCRTGHRLRGHAAHTHSTRTHIDVAGSAQAEFCRFEKVALAASCSSYLSDEWVRVQPLLVELEGVPNKTFAHRGRSRPAAGRASVLS